MQNSFQAITNFGIPTFCWRGLSALGLLCAVVSALAGSHPLALAQVAANREAKKAKTLVCVVSGEGESEMSVDAVVVVGPGKLGQPYPEQKDLKQAGFANEYFGAGRQYRLTFGGGDAGTVTIRKWDKGCNNIHATAEVKTSLKLSGRLRALATNSETLGSKQSARRAPTADERAGVLRVVKQVYASKGVIQSMLPRITTTNLTATDLNGDGKYELVGSFVIASANKFRRDLFLITESQDAGYKTALVDYQSYQPPPEGFDSAIDFVDQLDLDADGIGEVFVIQAGFDAYSYLIYKKQNGRWRKVYSAMGDAC